MNSPTGLPGSGVTFAGQLSPIAPSPGQDTGESRPFVKESAANEPANASSEVSTLAAVVELLVLASQAERFDQSCENIARAMRDWLGADRVDVAWQPRPRSMCKWVAGTGVPDEGASITVARDAAANEVLIRGGIADSGAIASRDRIALLAVKRFCTTCKAKRVLGIALGEVDDPGATSLSQTRCWGALLIRFDRPVSENESARMVSRLEICRGPITTALGRIADSQPTAVARFLRSTRELVRTRRWRLSLCFLVMSVAILLIPFRYQVNAKCELQPVFRRYITVPINAPLESVYVRPGDEVQTGQSLATLDSHEIEMELAAKRAELERVRQEQKGQIAQHKFAEGKLTALRAERLQSEANLLEHRRERLELVAPIDGLVVAGDWKRSEGIVLERGETLFEVAPLGTFLIEVLIDESDLLSLRSGMPLKFRLDAMPGELFHAKIERIHPRAEIRDDESVFVAEATVRDPAGRLRPGMHGRGKVTSDRHPLGWNLFHKAYYRATAILGGS